MKKNIFIISILAIFVSSCSKESTSDVSEVTNFAIIEAEPVVVVELGGTFVPSATATENGVNVEVSVISNVNTNVVGVYDVTYVAVNTDGFEATAFQSVVVHDPSIVGTDVSGNIWDKNNNSRTGIISLVEGTTSIFYVTDFGFAGTFPMYFQMDGDVISEIPQTYALSVTSVDLGYDPSVMEFTTVIHPYGFSYTFEYQN